MKIILTNLWNGSGDELWFYYERWPGSIGWDVRYHHYWGA